jgi:tRNA uridine 5-carboxymethylaminomethyl modification enzyme
VKYQNKLKNIDGLKSYLQSNRCDGLSLWDQLRRPGNTIAEHLAEDDYVNEMGFGKEVLDAVIIDAKYEGYLAKQSRLVDSFKSLENKKIPPGLDYNRIEHLRAEAKEKLSVFRPGTLAQAGRISGITPADVTVVQIHLKKYH